LAGFLQKSLAGFLIHGRIFIEHESQVLAEETRLSLTPVLSLSPENPRTAQTLRQVPKASCLGIRFLACAATNLAHASRQSWWFKLRRDQKTRDKGEAEPAA
jgi:hypothetical protein